MATGYTNVDRADEYHEHVDNNFYTNRLAQWNLQTAFKVLEWLKNQSPDTAQRLIGQLIYRVRDWRSGRK